MMSVIMTETAGADADTRAQARERAEVLGIPYFERQGSLEYMTKLTGTDCFLIYEKNGPVYRAGSSFYRYHIGSAALRLLQLKKTGYDRLCSLLPETRPLSVLDATFGMGGDSAVISWFLGSHGRVTALECEPVLWEIGQYGLRHWKGEPDVETALRRILLKKESFQKFLRSAEPRSFDVVYFDTMFKIPVDRSDNMKAFRQAACTDSLSEEVLSDAVRAARRRVIVKERPFSSLFKNPLFQTVHRRRGQSTAYGVIDL
jgi:hypothetical protein